MARCAEAEVQTDAYHPLMHLKQKAHETRRRARHAPPRHATPRHLRARAPPPRTHATRTVHTPRPSRSVTSRVRHPSQERKEALLEVHHFSAGIEGEVAAELFAMLSQVVLPPTRRPSIALRATHATRCTECLHAVFFSPRHPFVFDSRDVAAAAQDDGGAPALDGRRPLRLDQRPAALAGRRRRRTGLAGGAGAVGTTTPFLCFDVPTFPSPSFLAPILALRALRLRHLAACRAPILAPRPTPSPPPRPPPTRRPCSRRCPRTHRPPRRRAPSRTFAPSSEGAPRSSASRRAAAARRPSRRRPSTESTPSRR